MSAYLQVGIRGVVVDKVQVEQKVLDPVQLALRHKRLLARYGPQDPSWEVGGGYVHGWVRGRAAV